MKFLIVDDEFNNRHLLRKMLEPYGQGELVVNGEEALQAFEMALVEGEPYDLVCMDIMMPVMDGQTALPRMRALEKQFGVSGPDEVVIFMITALSTGRHVLDAFFRGGCSDYLVKPVTVDVLMSKLKEFHLIEDGE